MNENYMILNDINVGISQITLDKSALKIIDKYNIYCLRIFLYYNWKEINNIKIGQKEKINFNEYILSENNEPALVWPTKSYVEKLTNESLCFYFMFKSMSKTITYMNERNSFNILPETLEVKVVINFNDVSNKVIIYEF